MATRMRTPSLKRREVEADKLGSDYSAERLFDYLKDVYKLKTDSALADFVEVRPSVISRVRRGVNGRAVSDDLILKIHDVTGMTIKQIKYVMYDRSVK